MNRVRLPHWRDPRPPWLGQLELELTKLGCRTEVYYVEVVGQYEWAMRVAGPKTRREGFEGHRRYPSFVRWFQPVLESTVDEIRRCVQIQLTQAQLKD